ncbi:MAG: hypothetical protein ABI652_00620 [Acidobacteriota bacterium]
MAEPKRSEPLDASATASRDSQVEAVLVDGLDRYFNGEYEDAIHLWTRVLFLDRSHARARAYIDRARTALAERQRRAEEMLHATGELLAQGNTDQARHLLTEAVRTSGDDERAAELRLQIERVERARPAHRTSGGVSAAVVDAVPIGLRGRRAKTGIAIGTLVALVVLAVGLFEPVVREWLGFDSSMKDLVLVSATATRPVLSKTDVALVRARTLYSQGRLSEALVILDRVGSESASRPVADQLRVEIQQLLLATGRRASPAERVQAGRP